MHSGQSDRVLVVGLVATGQVAGFDEHRPPVILSRIAGGGNKLPEGRERFWGRLKVASALLEPDAQRWGKAYQTIGLWVLQHGAAATRFSSGLTGSHPCPGEPG